MEPIKRVAKRIVGVVEDALSDRSGLDWSEVCDEETLDELREELVSKVALELEKASATDG